MTDERPEWWRRNEQCREQMGLPAYDPSRFTDGVYVHETIDALEDEYDCQIRLESVDPTYPSRWAIQVDDRTCATIRRRRTENGNNVYQLTSNELRERVAALLE